MGAFFTHAKFLRRLSSRRTSECLFGTHNASHASFSQSVITEGWALRRLFHAKCPLNFFKRFNLVLFALLLVAILSIKLFPKPIVDFCDQTQPELVEYLFPEVIAEPSEVLISKIKVKDNAITVFAKTKDSKFVVRRVSFRRQFDTLEVSVYQGMQLNHKITNATYQRITNMKNINTVLLCGLGQNREVIWQRK